MSDAQLPLSEIEQRYRRRRILLFALILLGVSAFGLFSNYGFLTRWSLERHRTALADSLAQLQHNSDSLRARARELRSDTLEIERLARERYGMSKPGEQVFVIQKENGH